MTNKQAKAPTAQSSKYPLLETVRDDFHPKAISEAEKHIDHFITALISHAKSCAFEKQDEMILRNHINEALKAVERKNNNKRWHKVGLFISSTMLGIVIPNFLTELAKFDSPPTSDAAAGSTTLVTIYFVAALITVSASIWLILTENS
jgi:hypothetical protein